DVLGREVGDRLAVLGDGELTLARELSLAVEGRDLVLLQKVLNPGRELAGDGAAALHHLGEVEAYVLHRKREGVGMLHQMLDFGGAQQRLGRDAAPVEADAAEMFALD